MRSIRGEQLGKPLEKVDEEVILGLSKLDGFQSRAL